MVVISIHAPVKGATLAAGDRIHRRGISIHAPVKGATQQSCLEPSIQGISIHAPVKGATTVLPGQASRLGISIHAPVKGATRWSCLCLGFRCHFNPRSREGSDLVDDLVEALVQEFQSTLP